MIIKAKNLRRGDRVGEDIIREIKSIRAKIYRDIKPYNYKFVIYNSGNSAYYRVDDDIAIHRGGNMIKAEEIQVGDVIDGFMVDRVHLSSHGACCWGHSHECDEFEFCIPLGLTIEVLRSQHDCQG